MQQNTKPFNRFIRFVSKIKIDWKVAITGRHLFKICAKDHETNLSTIFTFLKGCSWVNPRMTPSINPSMLVISEEKKACHNISDLNVLLTLHYEMLFK